VKRGPETRTHPTDFPSSDRQTPIHRAICSREVSCRHAAFAEARSGSDPVNAEFDTRGGDRARSRESNTARSREALSIARCRMLALQRRRAPGNVIAGAMRSSLGMMLSRVMLQLFKLPTVMRRLRHLAALTAVGVAVGLMVVPLDAAPHQLVPVPLPRPATPGARSMTPSAAAAPNRDQKPSQTEDTAREDEACLSRLRAAGVRFDIATMPVAAKAACTIQIPVRLKSVTTRARAVTEIRLPEEPVVSCEFAERLTAWLGHLVAPLITGVMSTDLRAVHTGPGYECRNRNGAAVGKLSAHAIGKAIDISGFELSSGKFIHVKPEGEEAMRDVVDSVRTAACGWFTTVLGPGSDAAHTDHLHVDIALHGTSDRYRICQ
jgi:hypothetical protein